MTKSQFPFTKFGELIEPNPSVSLARSEAHSFVAMEDLTPSRRYVMPSAVRELTGGARFNPGDTLFARITPCLQNGKIAQFDPRAQTPGFGSTEFIVLRAKPARADPGFILYLSRTDWVRGPAIKSMTGASGRQRARAEAIINALVPDVPLPEQRRIASTLGAYDDLIEINLRRIARLEEVARRLFEEWFVRLHIPNYANHKIVETPEGPLPEGWRWGAADELIEFEPKTGMAKEGSKPFIPMDSLSTENSLISEIEWREGKSGAKFRNEDTLFARITPCLENGKTGLVRDLPGDGVGFGSTEFIVMRARKAGPAFCYLLARYSKFREHARRSMSGASGRQRARTESLRAFVMPVPPTPVLDGFEQKVWPLLQLSGLLGKTNARLTAARDLLLPRLISGELLVPKSERDLEAVA
jgi:type I restriction enzyme S subunit